MPSALITGASRGLGFEFARQYLADGWQVYAACRDPASASELRQLAEVSNDRLRILAIDVTDPASIHSAATELGGKAIDLLLNNAGIIGPRSQTIGNIDYEAWAEVLAVNTMGAALVVQRVTETRACHCLGVFSQAKLHGVRQIIRGLAELHFRHCLQQRLVRFHFGGQSVPRLSHLGEDLSHPRLPCSLCER